MSSTSNYGLTSFEVRLLSNDSVIAGISIDKDFEPRGDVKNPAVGFYAAGGVLGLTGFILFFSGLNKHHSARHAAAK